MTTRKMPPLGDLIVRYPRATLIVSWVLAILFCLIAWGVVGVLAYLIATSW